MKHYIKNWITVFLGGVLLIACLPGTTMRYANWNEPHEYPIQGWGGEYVYNIAFSDNSGVKPLPIEASEGRGHSNFLLDFREKNFRRDVRLSLSLNPIRLTNLETGKIYISHNEIITKYPSRIFTHNTNLDLPLGPYRIEFSGRFCANGVCKNFSQILEKELFLDSHFYSRF